MFEELFVRKLHYKNKLLLCFNRNQFLRKKLGIATIPK